jgi:tRNA-dihydrouridine synthase
MLHKKGLKHVIQRLKYSEIERPLVAQIWGNNPKSFFEAAKMIVDLQFDGVDINMGCPEKGVVKKCAGGGMIKDYNLASEVIQAVKEGVAGKIPVSVKTRIGVQKIETESWTTHLLKQDIVALTIHARTVAEQSEVPAHWDEIKKAVEVRNALGVKTLMIGNGDVISYDQALEYVKNYGVDGIMVGRGIFHNPWIFNKVKKLEDVTIKERLDVFAKHIQLYDQTWGKNKNFEAMKKFCKAYLRDFDGAAELRAKLMLCHNAESILKEIHSYKQA